MREREKEKKRYRDRETDKDRQGQETDREKERFLGARGEEGLFRKGETDRETENKGSTEATGRAQDARETFWGASRALNRI